MTEDLNDDLFRGPKWPGNWASEANIQHTFKSTSNWHVKQDSWETSGICLIKWPKTRVFTYFGAQGGHFSHTRVSTHNMPVNQVSRSCIKNFIFKNSHFLLFLKELEAKDQNSTSTIFGQYLCAYSSQISERSDENWGSLVDLKKRLMDGWTDRQMDRWMKDGSASDKLCLLLALVLRLSCTNPPNCLNQDLLFFFCDGCNVTQASPFNGIISNVPYL